MKPCFTILFVSCRMSCDCPFSVINKELSHEENHHWRQAWKITFNDDNCNFKLLRQLAQNKSDLFLHKTSDLVMFGISKILDGKPCECIDNLKSKDTTQAITGCNKCNNRGLVSVNIIHRRKNVVTVGFEYSAIDCVDENFLRQSDASSKSRGTSESQSSSRPAGSSC